VVTKADEKLVPVYCTNGHAILVWGNPLMAKPGEVVRWWGNPFLCGQCGASCKGGT
jgi:hypothetical protein